MKKSKKHRRRMQQQPEAARERGFAALAWVSGILAALILSFGAYRLQSAPRSDPSDNPETTRAQPRAENPPRSYLAQDLPADDEAARRLIRREYYSEAGFTLYKSEREVPLQKVFVPEKVFEEQELEILAAAISTIGEVCGKDDPAFVRLQEWAARKNGRLIEEILPLDHKFGIGTGKDVYFVDAYWFGETGFLYIGRHVMPYYMLLVSSLYHEAYHATQLGRTKAVLQQMPVIELETHRAQLEFNSRLRSVFLRTAAGPESRRWRLELDVIDQNLRDAIARYQTDSIRREGMVPSKQAAE